jgi:type III pantothenate kinase
MNTGKVTLVIDAGNTAIKAGVFQNNHLIETYRFSVKEINQIDTIIKQIQPDSYALASVMSEKDTQTIEARLGECYRIDKQVAYPINILYNTKETLGMDRICNAAAIKHLSPNHNCVSIDIGTCLKFDFVDDKGNYQGGSISPGIHLRYKALNEYTAKLPLLEDTSNCDLVGSSTATSMQSGVINGLKAEISSMIEFYTKQFGNLSFFITGGDARCFDFAGKNNIFVDENLTLKGLYLIYLFNAK